jgi:hypothetical protein
MAPGRFHSYRPEDRLNLRDILQTPKTVADALASLRQIRKGVYL